MKVSKHGVQTEYGKYRPEKALYFDSFHAVYVNKKQYLASCYLLLYKIENQSDVSKITYDSKPYMMHCPNWVERLSANYLHSYKALF